MLSSLSSWARGVAASAAVSLAVAGCGPTQPRVLRLGHALDTQHPVHRALEYLSRRASELSGGRLRIDVYPDGQLGNERKCLESVQIGFLDMTKVSSSILENLVPSMAVFSLPYLFEDQKHKWSVLEGTIGKQILADCDKYLLHGLCYYETGSRSFYFVSRPVHRPSDLQGLKIRVMEGYWSIRTVRALGGFPVPIAFRELREALEQGVVDGAENNIPTFRNAGHYRICRYYVFDRHTSPPDVLVVSRKTWDRLSRKERRWLQQAAEESVARQREFWAEAEARDMEEIRKAGVTWIEVDREEFRRQAQPIYDELRKSHPELYRLVAQIQAKANNAPSELDAR